MLRLGRVNRAGVAAVAARPAVGLRWLASAPGAGDLDTLRDLESKVLWLSSYMIHNANNLRPKRDGIKVGGHQASSSSMATILTALYFSALRPHDRVAVKPHASPIFHAIQYMLGHQSLDQLERFRSLGGVQAYPSRTKDKDDVDFSTGSVGLGAAVTTFAALTQDYLALKGGDFAPQVPAGTGEDAARPGRMIAIVGDAELDEGNVYEVLLESWKHKVRNNWWIIDYNRQSLDNVVGDNSFRQIDRLFRSNGFRVLTVKYGKLLQAAFDRPGGRSLRRWMNAIDNVRYSVLTFSGGKAFRAALERDLADDADALAIVAAHDDDALFRLMTNLGGHCMETLLEAFEEAGKESTPTCFITYTVKGYGLPLAGHRDNHSGLLNTPQMTALQASHKVPVGSEWDRFVGLSTPRAKLEAFLSKVPFARGGPGSRRLTEAPLPVPDVLSLPPSPTMSTQEAFGKLMMELGRSTLPLASRIVTTAPDVATSTNLGGWVNQRGVFGLNDRPDVFRASKMPSMQKWDVTPKGQHIELGIAENNLFLILAALGLSSSVFGRRLLPIGTLYDPFIARGLDALNYACYMDARMLLVATPSGVSLAPEGGAHQSINTPLIGLSQPGLVSYEPAFADELAVITRHAFVYMQEEKGGSVYLRLSTRPLDQPQREMTTELRDDIIKGAYWRVAPSKKTKTVLAYAGTVAPEASKAVEGRDDVALLAVTSHARLYSDWHKAAAFSSDSHIASLLAAVPQGAKIVTVQDGHPAALAWLGSVQGNATRSLGVTTFGQSSDIIDAYKIHNIDVDAIRAAL